MYNYLNSAYYGYLHKIAEDMGNRNRYNTNYYYLLILLLLDMTEDYIDWVLQH